MLSTSKTPIIISIFIVGLCACDTETTTDDWLDLDEEIEPRSFNSQSGISVAKGQFKYFTFDKLAGYHYTRCIDVVSGDADIYGHYLHNPTTGDWQFSLQNGGTKSDCISFDATSGGVGVKYYVGIYGYASSSQVTYRMTNFNSADTPSNLSKQLTWPISACKSLTKPTDGSGNVVTADNTPSFGAFGAPWGNHEYNPFYVDECNGNQDCKNYLHTGVDIACSSGTEVKAACTGPVKDSGSAGTEWGSYLVQECTGANNTKYSVAYVHIANKTSSTNLTAGVSVVGKVFDQVVPGESDHLHFAICNGSYATCSAATCSDIPSKTSKPQNGALPDVCFPGLLINAHIGTNPNLYK